VPRSTLKLRLDHKIEASRHMSGCKQVLNNKTEDELVSIIKELAQRGFPLDMKEVRTIVYSYAEQNGIHGFSQKKKKKEGYEWFHAFVKQHPDISIQTSEPLSIARAMGMNEVVKMHGSRN